MMAAQDAIHKVSAGEALSNVLHEFKDIIGNWAMHPSHRNWDLINKLEKFIDDMNNGS